MKKSAILILTLAAVTGFAFAAEKKAQLKDLPPAVQKTVHENTEGATIKGIVSETENGQFQYEVESTMKGKGHDFIVDTKGGLVEVEDETNIDSLPAPAKAAILKKVGDGKLGLVETVTKGSKVSYEAAYKTKAGKKASVSVNADGSAVK